MEKQNFETKFKYDNISRLKFLCCKKNCFCTRTPWNTRVQSGTGQTFHLIISTFVHGNPEPQIIKPIKVLYFTIARNFHHKSFRICSRGIWLVWHQIWRKLNFSLGLQKQTTKKLMVTKTIWELQVRHAHHLHHVHNAPNIHNIQHITHTAYTTHNKTYTAQHNIRIHNIVYTTHTTIHNNIQQYTTIHNTQHHTTYTTTAKPLISVECRDVIFHVLIRFNSN